MRSALLVPALLGLLAAPAARAYDPHRPDSHAPIGVMGDHTHEAGEIMLSYRYRKMRMDGNRDGTSRVGTGEVLEDFLVTPTSMDAEMHMFGAMWAPTDWLTLMTMVPYVRKNMDHVTRTGVEFRTRTQGLGDIKLTGLFRVFRNENHTLHLNAGLSFPTGSTTREDDTPMGKVRLPYPMQIGSGTWDLLPGLTYAGQLRRWSWGGQVMGTITTGRNDQGYRWGNRYNVTAWGAREWLPWISTSLRLDLGEWGNIHGRDSELNPSVVPTADPDLRAGRRLDGLVGVNLFGRKGWLRGQRLAFEFGWPLWQHLDGPQLETDWLLTAGWQYSF